MTPQEAATQRPPLATDAHRQMPPAAFLTVVGDPTAGVCEGDACELPTPSSKDRA